MAEKFQYDPDMDIIGLYGKNKVTNDGGIVINKESDVPKNMPDTLKANIDAKLKELEAPMNIVKEEVKETPAVEDMRPSAELDAVKRAFAKYEVDGDKVSPKESVEAKREAEEIERVRQQAIAEKKEAVQGVVQINVPEGKAGEVLSQMSRKEREVVQQAKTIVVNEVELKKVPTAKKKITSIDQYKKMARKRVSGETIQLALPNSKFVVTVKEAGSLAMASMLGDMRDDNIDYAKRLEFCYDYIVATSIGDLSYDEFVKNIHGDDIPLIIYGILRASSPDRDKLGMKCGNRKCAGEYEHEYVLSDLLDLDLSHEKLLPALKEITEAARTIDDAKKCHETASIMNPKYIQVDEGVVVKLSPLSGYTLLERSQFRDQIVSKYNMLVSVMSMVVLAIYIDAENEDGEMETYEIDEIEVIADILYNMQNEPIEIIKKCIEEIDDIGEVKFSIKSVKCPHCGITTKKIPINIDQLVFTKIQKVILS